jgi:hypothetical protein
MRATSLLAILARIHPEIWEIWDIVHGTGPLRSLAATSRLAEVALNPQPLPPGPSERLQRASALVARDIALAAITAEAAGERGGVRMITSAIDDWCGNGRPPIPIPWPGPWPFAFAVDEAPQHLDVAASRLVGALSFAALASRMGAGDVRDALSAGADRLMDAALGAGTKDAALSV